MKRAIIIILALVAIFVLVSAAFPEPFIDNENRTATTIVIGNSLDRAAAQELLSFLRGNEENESDSFLFQRASNRLNLGENLTSVQTGIIDDNELPNLLASSQFETDNGDFDYDQRISLADNLMFTVFRDNDINNNDPTIGIRIPNGQRVLNYSVDFTETVISDITDNNLRDLEDSKIELLGKTYTIVSASPDRFELLGGASQGSLNIGETKTFIVNGTSFTIESLFIDSDEARFRVNGEETRSLSEGDTTNIAGTTLAVISVDFQNFAGGIQRVRFQIGASRLILTDGNEVKMNDDTIEGLVVNFDSTTSDEEYQLRALNFDWTANEDLFIAQNVSAENEAILPGFNSLRFVMMEFITPLTEELMVEPEGDDVISLRIMTEDSNTSFDLPILFSDGTSFTSIGGDNNTDLLVTSNGDTVIWDDNTDEFLVVSWNGEEPESHILRLNIGTERNDDVVNFINQVTGQEEETNVRAGDVANIGQIELTVVSIDSITDTALIRINSGAGFNTLYTREGLRIFLPVSSVDNAVEGAINLENETTEWILNLTEEDEDENAGEGQSFGIPLMVDAGEVKVGTPVNIGEIFAGGVFGRLDRDRDVRVGWIKSPLATRIELDSSADQTVATIIYHGEESYGQVFLTSESNFTGNNISNADVEIIDDPTDTESFRNRNLIVIGGTCVNNLSAQLLEVNFPLCGDDWENETNVGPGEFIIRTFKSPFNETENQVNVATLVAGYERQETLDAVRFLIEERPDISEGETTIR